MAMNVGDLVVYYDSVEKENCYGLVLKKQSNGFEVLWFDNLSTTVKEIEGVDGVEVVSRCDESR